LGGEKKQFFWRGGRRYEKEGTVVGGEKGEKKRGTQLGGDEKRTTSKERQKNELGLTERRRRGKRATGPQSQC